MKSRGVKHFIHLIDERKINFVTKKQLTQSTLQKRYNHAQIALLLLFVMIFPSDNTSNCAYNLELLSLHRLQKGFEYY